MEPEVSLPQSQVSANCPYPEPARSRPYPPHPTYLRSILILSSHLHLVLPSVLFHSGFPTKTLYTPLLSTIRATCPAHLILHDFFTRKILCAHYRSSRTSLYSFLQSPVNLSFVYPDILLNTLFLNTLFLCSSLSVRDQVSHPYKTTGKIIQDDQKVFVHLMNTIEKSDVHGLFLEHPLFMFLPQRERPNFAPIQNNRQNYTGWSKSLCEPDECNTEVRCTRAFWSPCISEYFNPHIFGKQNDSHASYRNV